jgi:hypothetical protein
LKKKYGSETEPGLCKIRTNQEPRELHKTSLLLAEIKGASLDWLRHVIGMDKTNVVEEYSETDLESRRKKGKCKLKWLEKVENYLQELRSDNGKRQVRAKNMCML